MLFSAPKITNQQKHLSENAMETSPRELYIKAVKCAIKQNTNLGSTIACRSAVLCVQKPKLSLAREWEKKSRVRVCMHWEGVCVCVYRMLFSVGNLSIPQKRGSKSTWPCVCNANLGNLTSLKQNRIIKNDFNVHWRQLWQAI